MQELRDELSSCPMDMEEVDMMKTFGIITDYKCNFKVHGLTENNPLTLPLQANAFFELYLEDANQNLIDVPVLIKNFRDIDGASPNSSYDSGKSRLVHRFFVYDTISGIEKVGGYATNAPPAIIRYASSAKMTV